MAAVIAEGEFTADDERTVRAWQSIAAAKLKCAEARTAPSGTEDALTKFREYMRG